MRAGSRRPVQLPALLLLLLPSALLLLAGTARGTGHLNGGCCAACAISYLYTGAASAQGAAAKADAAGMCSCPAAAKLSAADSAQSDVSTAPTVAPEKGLTSSRCLGGRLMSMRSPPAAAGFAGGAPDIVACAGGSSGGWSAAARAAPALLHAAVCICARRACVALFDALLLCLGALRGVAALDAAAPAGLLSWTTKRWRLSDELLLKRSSTNAGACRGVWLPLDAAPALGCLLRVRGLGAAARGAELLWSAAVQL
jgi:hypothetical protein